MAQLHQQHFETSQNQTKALENIASTSSFTSTVGCIPIYNGKDKDACTEWLQRCKVASYYTGYNFGSALLQRSSQDVAKVIQSLDEELLHDKLIKEIMCVFSGIPSTAAALDELSCICQQPGQNLLIYINKYRDLHWWCTKKLPHEETYKLTLSQFCSSLQDPIGRKLCKKLWNDKENCKLLNLQKCFDEATRAYKWYRVTEHRKELEVFEASVKINKPTNRNLTVVDSTTTATIIRTIPRAPKTTAAKERQPTTMAPKYNANSALDPRRSSKSVSCWKNMQTTPTDTQR